MLEALPRTSYMPGREPLVSVDFVPTTEDYDRMMKCNELGEFARRHGTTPCGAILVHPPSGGQWEDYNREFDEQDSLGHPDISVYQQFRRDLPELGLDLSQCVMYSNVETCIGCSYFVVKKPRLGMLI